MTEAMNQPLLGVSATWEEGLSTSHAHSNIAQEYAGRFGPLEAPDNDSIKSKSFLRTFHRAKCLIGDIQPYEGFVFLPLSAVELILMSYVGKVAGSIYKALVDMDETSAWKIIRFVFLLYSIYIIVSSATELIAGMLVVKWRRRLVSLLQEMYCQQRGFVHTVDDFDNTDQRLTAEASELCNLMSYLSKQLAGSPLKVMFYGYMAATYTGMSSILSVLVFFVISLFSQQMVSIELSKRIVSLEKCEGDFRKTHMRLKQFSEDIAAQKDVGAENEALASSLSATLGAQTEVVWYNVALYGIIKCTDYFGSILNYVLIALAVLYSKQQFSSKGGEIAEFVSNASFFTLSFVNSLTEIVDMGQQIAKFAALLARIYEVKEAMQQPEHAVGTKREMQVSNPSVPDDLMMSQNTVHLLLPPTQFEFETLDFPMEISVVSIRGGLLEDVKDVFPDLSDVESLLCCLTLQFDGVQSMDLPSLDVSLNKFLSWEKAIINALGSDVWCNSVDPKTGKALRGSQGSSWSEVTAFHSFLRYPIVDGDLCSLIVHPSYGTSTYPVSFFTTATFEDFLAAIERIKGHPTERPMVSIIDASITPRHSEACLLAHFSLLVHPEEHLLISGPNGSGKTSLLHAIFRSSIDNRHDLIWNPNLLGQDNCHIMHVSQAPLLAPGKYLWQQIAYPKSSRPQQSDLVEAIMRVGLLELVQSLPNGFDEVRQWKNYLSFGQQQRLVLARIFLHKPRLVLLDEAFSGIEESHAIELLRQIQCITSASNSAKTTCITVAQDTVAMRGNHRLHLQIREKELANGLVHTIPKHTWTLNRL